MSLVVLVGVVLLIFEDLVSVHRGGRVVGRVIVSAAGSHGRVVVGGSALQRRIVRTAAA